MLLLSLAVVIITGAHQVKISQAANILFYAAFGTHSTRISQWPLMEALADKGHNVTFLSPLSKYEQKPGEKSKILHYVPKILSKEFKGFEEMNFYQRRVNSKTIDLEMWTLHLEMGKSICKLLYSDPEYLDFIKSNVFEIVIMDTCCNECAYGAIHKWNAKYALYLTTTVLPFHIDPFGVPDESSSIPEVSTVVADRTNMSFYERFFNMILPILSNIYKEYLYLPFMEQLTRQRLETEGLPTFHEMDRNVNLLFLTSHHSYDYARSLPRNVIQIGGNVIVKKPKPLPKDMQEFLDSSPNGFIYVSFGTVTEFTHFDEKVQIEFIKALAQFPHIKFLWKVSKPITAASIPKNVMTAKWMPQQTILAHPKIKAYITHSGMGSTVEAIHFSVPLICIPILFDQDMLADNIARRGAGVKVEIVDMKMQDLVDAITDILENSKYKKAMNRLTAIFKDRMSPPLETAVWWIEYLLRHENTNEFLLSPSTKQPWWKRRKLDVSIILFVILTLPLLLIFCIIKRVFCNSKSNRRNKLKQS